MGQYNSPADVARIIAELTSRVATLERVALIGTRLLRGIVNANGTIQKGIGFTITKGTAGIYTVNFTQPFSDVPAFAGFIGQTGGIRAIKGNGPATASAVGVATLDGAGTLTDSEFHFVAVGPP